MPESNTPVNSQPDFGGSIEINNEPEFDVPLQRITEAARLVLVDYGFQRGDISIALVGNQQIHAINNKYLNHDYETDVISFVLEKQLPDQLLNGEIIVSVEMAHQMADQHRTMPDDELLLYVIHGMLHLVGRDDTSQELAAVMRAEEQRFLKLLGVEGVIVDPVSESGQVKE